MTTFTLGTSVNGGGTVAVDLERLIETRMCLQANSGGGKSWTVRRLLEQSHGKVMQIVIDAEGEFYTLREKYDYLYASVKGGDCVASVALAKKLAHRLLEHGVSAIVDISEMPPAVRVEFVREFVEALVEAPRRLWRPCMVVVDEAHRFCPEVERGHKVARGKKTERVSSTDAVVNLMALGRKRGLCGVLATQRIAKLNKDALAECQNFLVGLANIDVDQDRAAAALGMRPKDAVILRELEPGEFFAFGPAIARAIQKVRVGPVQTTHPKAGQRTAPLPPTRSGIKRVVASFADLPAEVEEETSKIASLEAEVKKLRAAKPAPAPAGQTALGALTLEQIRTAEQKGYERGRAEAGHVVRAVKAALQKVHELVEKADSSVGVTLSALVQRVHGIAGDVEKLGLPAVTHRDPKPANMIQPGAVPPVTTPPLITGYSGRPPLDGPEQKIVDAIAWFNAIGIAEPEGPAVAAVAGYKVNGGGFKNPRSRLSTKGMVTYPTPGTLALTDAGRACAKPPDVASLTGEAFRAKILEILDGPERKILTPLLAAWPDRMTADAVAQDAGYGVDGGGFKNPRSRLSTLGLIEYPTPGTLRARDILFPERN